MGYGVICPECDSYVEEHDDDIWVCDECGTEFYDDEKAQHDDDEDDE